MSNYKSQYAMHYSCPSLQQQAEVATVVAANSIVNEDPATADHANRLSWAQWVLTGSPVAWNIFAWPVCSNPTIQAAYDADQTGSSIQDSDVQFVVNSNIEMAVKQYVSGPYYHPA
jgi:hypothetical protein